MVEEKRQFTGMDGRPALKVPAWKVRLASEVSKACLCRMFWNSGTYCSFEVRPGTFTYVGRKGNVEIAQYLFTYLERFIQDIASELKKASNGLGRSWWNSWYRGCVNTIGRRLKEELKAFESQGENCRALVQDKLREATRYLDQHHPNLRQGGPTVIGDLNGYAAGNAAGE